MLESTQAYTVEQEYKMKKGFLEKKRGALDCGWFFKMMFFQYFALHNRNACSIPS